VIAVRRHARRGGGGVRLARAVVAAVVGLAALVGAGLPASAAEYVTGEWGAWRGMSTFWGNMAVGGVYGLCVDPGAEPPDGLDPAHAKTVCGTTTNGVADKTAQTAWLMGLHIKDTDTQTLVSLSQFARSGYHTGIPVTYPARHQQLVAEAAHAGGKDAHVEVDLAASRVWVGLVRAGQAAQIASGALDRSAASFTPGFAATVVITSPNATFADGSRTKTIITGSSASGLAFTTSHDLVAGEQVTATVKVTGVPRECFTLYEEGSYQRVITPLYADVSGSHTATQDKTIWQPRVTTEVTTPTVQARGTVTDKVKAEAVGGSQWPVKEWADPAQTTPKTYHPFTATGRLVYSPTVPAASGTLSAGSSVLPGVVSAVLPGPGVWATTTMVLPDGAGSGFYSLRWCLDKADQGANAKYLPDGGPFCDDYHAATERLTVPMRLAISTKAPNAVVSKGDPADDTVTLSLPDPADKWITTLDGKATTVKAHGVLYGSSTPFAEQATAPAGARVLGEADVTVTLPTSARAPVTVPAPAGFDLKGSTYWSWVWGVDRADQTPAVAAVLAGDTRDRFGRPGESGHTPMTLAITSNLPDRAQAKGQAPDDTITISLPDPDDQWIARPDGKPAVVKAHGVFHAASATTYPVSAEAPADAKVVGEATVEVTLPTSGRAPVTVAAPAGFTVPTSQYGVWVWEIRRADQDPQVAALFDNDPKDGFGQPSETHATQMELTIRSQTQASDLPEPVGEATVEVCDRVWAEHTTPGDLWLNQWGTHQPVEVKVTGALHHSAVPAAQTTNTTGVPKVAEWEVAFTAAGEANAQIVCHEVGAGGHGAYGFAWRIDLASQPDATRELLSGGAVSALWLPEETTIVKPAPVIRTAATAFTTTSGGQEVVFLTDQVWQTGWPDGPDGTDQHAATTHGQWAGTGPWGADEKTIRVELWRIEGEVTPESCSEDNPAAALVAVNEATPARNTWDGADRVSGSRFKADRDATYTFTVSWPGDARTQPYESVCGEPSETITLTSQAPEFTTRLLKAADQDTAPNGDDAEAAMEVEPGAAVVDVLSVVFPDPDARKADMTGWQATWEFHHNPVGDQGAAPEVVADPSGRRVNEGAVCTPETRFAEVGPVPVERAGDHASPEVTVPDEPGMVHAVETVTDKDGKVVWRGTCGLVTESAIVKAPPKPGITTTAPATATVGERVTDLAELTGPYPTGTVVEFWYQDTPFNNPDAAPADLACDPPDPHDSEGAVHIGDVTLDHPIAEGAVETIQSPEFTVTEPGCTWIKETAHQPGDRPDREVIAEGRFDALNERTIWTPPPPELPSTGARVWGIAGAALIAIGLGAVGVAFARRLRGPF
jgi:hypothetical protein